MQAGWSVGAVILAAGASRRYGSPKQLVLVDGRTMLEHVVGVALAADLDPVVAVVPTWLTPPANVHASVQWVWNAFPKRGMSVSLRLGLWALGSDVSAALILLGDQPRIAPSTINAVLAERGKRPLVAASADGVLAPPVLIERSHFRLADDLAGDAGLRHLLRDNPDLVSAVSVPSHAPDLDTPDDIGRLGGP